MVNRKPQSRPDRLAAASLEPLGRKAVFTIADISSACVNERESERANVSLLWLF